MSSRRLRTILGLPSTAVGWWRRTTTAAPVELWAMLGGVPGVLTLLWLLPLGDGLAFSLAADSIFESRETFRSAFTANYVHVDGRHLFDNLVNFWVTLFAIYPLVSIARWGRQFRLAAASYLLVAPFVIAWLTLAILGPFTDKPSVGFSGITAAFLGFLPVVLAAAAHEVTDGTIETSWAVVPFSLSLAIVFGLPSVPYFPVPPLVAGGLAVSGLAVGGVLWRRQSWRRLRAYNRRLPPDERLAFLIGATVFVFGVLGALVVVPGGTNVWGHLAGYIVGFTVPYLGFVMRPSLIG
ncbi:MAG: hypothetical protein ACOC0Z_06960 [Halohasta sp.]